MKAYVYILHSDRLDKHYIGFTTYLPEERLALHNLQEYKNSYTSKGIPWTIFLQFQCENINQARQIEAHIKRMKSRKYIQNLKKYPEIIKKLKANYT